MAKIWRDDIDYSSELQRTDLTQAQRSQLETERAAKIADKYGGVEPNMSGSNVKFSDVYTGSGGSVLNNSGSPAARTTSDYKGVTYTQEDGKGIYGLPTINSQQKNYTQNGVTYQVGANMARRPDLAGKIAISNGYTVFYDDMGYATKAIKGVADYSPHQDYYVENGSYSGGHLWTDEEMLMPEDLARIAEIRAGIGTKYTGDQANQLANQIRSGYGYSIDKEGNVTDFLSKSRVEAFRDRLGLSNDPASAEQEYFVSLLGQAQEKDEDPAVVLLEQMLAQQGAGGSFGSDAPKYEGSKWDDVLNALAQQLVDMNYEDWTQSDQYASLARRYGNQGRMTMQDVLGQIASRTGGLASSYATSAAHQRYNDFMADLEQAAMDMYGVEREELLENAQLARQYSEDDYNKYLDRWNRWADNRDFEYGAYRDSVEDQRYADELAYDREMDAWEREQYASETDRAQAEEMAETLAAHGDYSGYKALGYTDEQISVMQAAHKAANTPKSTGGSTPKATKPNLTAAQTLAALKDGIVNDTTLAAYKYYYGQDWEDTGGDPKGNSSAPTSDYGTSYSSIWSRARTMYDSGKTDAEIAAFLDKFSETQLTDAGLDYIMKSLNLNGYRE